MSNLTTRFAFALTVSIALTACGGGNTVGAAAPAQAGAAFRGIGDAKTPNVSGEYAGTIKDSQNGKGRLTASLAQYTDAVGGSLTATTGTGSITSSEALTLSNADELTGSGAGTVGSAVCVYSVQGKYDAARHHLSGSYTAVNGCSGQSGTFTMKQKCYYAPNGTSPEVGGLKMC
jgi:hypothetical protein